MRGANGGRWSGTTWLLGLWMVASLSACSKGDEPSDSSDAIQGTGASAAAFNVGSGGMGTLPAGTGGTPGTGGMSVQTSTGTGGTPAGTTMTSGTGGTPASMDAGTKNADAGSDAATESDGSTSDAGSIMGDGGFTSVCAGGTVGMDSDNSNTPGLTVSREFAAVKYLAHSPNQILDFKTTLQVPKQPTSMQTLFIWPGLQSRDGAADPAGIGNGVLQPVLTWGGSCAPKSPQNIYDEWWISGMYVNVTSGAAGASGCAGGEYLDTQVSDLLDIDMAVMGTNWIQTISNQRTMKTVDFSIDLKGQVQNDAMWIIEVPSGESIRPNEDTVWTQNVLTFSMPVTSCQPDQAGGSDYFSAPVLSKDGLHCCWDKIILRADRSMGR
jgi:hypothetical protein